MQLGHLDNERNTTEQVVFLSISASPGSLEPSTCYFPSRTEPIPASNQKKYYMEYDADSEIRTAKSSTIVDGFKQGTCRGLMLSSSAKPNPLSRDTNSSRCAGNDLLHQHLSSVSNIEFPSCHMEFADLNFLFPHIPSVPRYFLICHGDIPAFTPYSISCTLKMHILSILSIICR